jgi:hypothetical protein
MPPEPSAPEPAAAADEAPLEVVFDRLKAFAQEHNRGAFASLEGGQLIERSDGRICIAVRNAFHALRLRERVPEFEAVCERFFGAPMQVEVVEGDSPVAVATPAPASGVAANGSREEARKLKQAALQNEAVNTALEVLEASIVDITPLGGPRS